ncbi:hypothetical protein EDC04DRAFT_2903218 [Pisolithus marmoratus]|nr:hypothetical protein EDC04DRAFT_2903218 [Pisolithus marmoratus]
MNVDDSWSDAASPTVSKPSKPPIDAHAIIASTSGVAENPAPHANRHMPATMQKATMENPHSEAATNTAVAIRSIEPNLVDNPRPVPAANTAVVSSMGFNSGKCPAQVDTAWVNTSPPSDSTHEPFISSKVILKELDYSSSLRNNLYNFMQEQVKERNELIKTFEGARLTIEQQHNSALAQADGNVKFAQLAEKHGRLQQELGNRDRIIEQQRAALEDLQAGFGMLQAKLDHEITRVNAEKEAQFAALMEKFEGALCQVEASRSPIQMQKEAEVAALAQKFEDALHQVEVSKSQIQMEKETEIVALAQKFEGALCQVKVLNQSQQLSHSTQP